MKKFYKRIGLVFSLYRYEYADDLTLKHVNAHAQQSVPGPYKVIFDMDGNFLVIFNWESPQQQTWWILKWT